MNLKYCFSLKTVFDILDNQEFFSQFSATIVEFIIIKIIWWSLNLRIVYIYLLNICYFLVDNNGYIAKEIVLDTSKPIAEYM